QSSTWSESPVKLVSSRKNGAFVRRFAASHAIPRRALLLQRDAAHRSASFFLNLRFALRASAPTRKREAVFNGLLQIVVGLRVVCIALAKTERLVMQPLLNLHQQLLNRHRQFAQRRTDLPFFSWAIPPRQHCRLLRHIFRAKFHTQRHAAHLPIVELPAW